MTPNETLAAARLLAIEKHKYFRAALTRLVPKPLPKCGTLGVTANAVLYWDPEVVERWGVKFTAAVLIHEVSHLLRDHPGRRGERNHSLFNIAGDLEINDDLISAGWKLPPPEFGKDGKTPGTEADLLLPTNLGFGDGKLAEEYYVLLQKKMEQEQAKQPKAPKQPKSPPPPKDEGDEAGDDEGDESGEGEEERDDAGDGEGEEEGDGESEGKGDGDGEGDEGEGDGGGDSADHDNPGEGEGEDGEGEGKSEGNPSGKGGNGGQAEGDASDGEQKKPPHSKTGHGHCGSCAGNELPFEEREKVAADERSDADLARMRREVAEAIRDEASKGRGTVPGGWARWAETALKPARIPWQQKLARLARAAVAFRAGMADFTRSKPSRRQSAIGYGIGKPMLSAMHSPKPEVAVIADTSGSMGSEELTTALREVRGIMLVCGTGVTFLSCDAQVHALKKARHWNEIPGLIKGGGGTDMKPAFEELSKLPKKPDVIICLTDGQIGDPGPEPRGCKVIWVSIGRYRAHAPFATWGDFLEIEDLETVSE